MTQRSDLNDEELVQCAQQGVQDAIILLYERYLPVVYRRIRYVISEPDVEDVTQEVFIAMIRSLKGFRGESQFRTWLRTVLNRTVADYYRRRDPVDFPALQEEDEEEAGIDPVLRSESATNTGVIDDSILVRQALGKLPTRYQEVLLLRFAENLPFLEIAHVQGQSLEATKSLYRRAVAMLQKQLEEAYA